MRLVYTAALAASLLSASLAHAAVLGESDVALNLTPTVFRLAPTNATFAFSYDAAAEASFSDSYSVQTGGTAETSAFGGFLGIPLTPSLFDTSGVFIDQDLFPSFAAFPQQSIIPYSVVPGDLALRYQEGSDFYYGYARLNGDGTLNIGFESTPNTGITAGSPITGPLAVPEPAAWALMLLGLGAIGGASRRRRGSVRLA